MGHVTSPVLTDAGRHADPRQPVFLIWTQVCCKKSVSWYLFEIVPVSCTSLVMVKARFCCRNVTRKKQINPINSVWAVFSHIQQRVKRNKSIFTGGLHLNVGSFLNRPYLEKQMTCTESLPTSGTTWKLFSVTAFHFLLKYEVQWSWSEFFTFIKSWKTKENAVKHTDTLSFMIRNGLQHEASWKYWLMRRPTIWNICMSCMFSCVCVVPSSTPASSHRPVSGVNWSC